MSLKPVFIRDMDSEVWTRAKVAAIKKGKTIPKWLKTAILAQLRKEDG